MSGNLLGRYKKGFPHFTAESLYCFGDPVGTRTLDPLIKSQLLYQLSYRVLSTVGGWQMYCLSIKITKS